MHKPIALVLSNAGDPYIPMLDGIRSRAELHVGTTAAELAEMAPRADLLLAWTHKQAEIEKLFPLCSNLKWIHLRWAGLDAVLFPDLIHSPVTLTNSRGVYSQSLGEFVMLGALYFAKDVPRLQVNKAAGKWAPFTMLELRGATMGIVAYGDIGKASAARAHALGMRVLANRRRSGLWNDDPIVSKTYGPDQLSEMIRECDYVVSAAPLTPETRGMIGEAAIGAMKPTAVLMNVGRGPVIDEPALIRALQEKRIKGAALDVFAAEPLAADSPLWGFDNVLISPHCADNTPTWNQEAMQFFLDNFDRYVTDQPLLNVVDKHAGY